MSSTGLPSTMSAPPSTRVRPSTPTTRATLSPSGQGRCGERVAKTPILPPSRRGTLWLGRGAAWCRVESQATGQAAAAAARVGSTCSLAPESGGKASSTDPAPCCPRPAPPACPPTLPTRPGRRPRTGSWRAGLGPGPPATAAAGRCSRGTRTAPSSGCAAGSAGGQDGWLAERAASWVGSARRGARRLRSPPQAAVPHAAPRQPANLRAHLYSARPAKNSALSSGRSVSRARAAGTSSGCRGVPLRREKQERSTPTGRSGKGM